MSISSALFVNEEILLFIECYQIGTREPGSNRRNRSNQAKILLIDSQNLISRQLPPERIFQWPYQGYEVAAAETEKQVQNIFYKVRTD